MKALIMINLFLTFGIEPSVLKCNELERCFNGINFSNSATIGNQLTSGIPSGNEWTGPGNQHSVNFDLTGTITTPIEWYYNSNNGGDFVPVNGMAPLSFISGTPINITVADLCGNPALLTPPQEREARMGKIVRNENAFVSDNTEHRLSEMFYAFYEIEKNDSILNLGEPDDTTYQNFYNNCQNSCIGGLGKVHSNYENEDIVAAMVSNNSVNANTLWEQNQKRVNEIYLQSIHDSVAINSTDSLELFDIAYQHSFFGGPGVFSARAILKLEVEDLENGSTRFFQENNLEGQEMNFFEVYPNPSSGNFEISFIGEVDEISIVIFDITGKICFTKDQIQENSFNISLNLPQGIYFIQGKNKNELTETKKIIITK